MPANVVLTGVGKDRVGIVAHLSEVLFEFGCNLLDSSMTQLRSEFAIIMMAQLPEEHSLEDLRQRLASVESDLGLTVFVRELSDEELAEPESEGEPFIVSVYGADHPGIVAGVTKRLADLGVNLTDVQTKRTSEESSLFMMILEIELPESMKEETLSESLKKVAAELQVEISLRTAQVVDL